jgi:hypothetical protein
MFHPIGTALGLALGSQFRTIKDGHGISDNALDISDYRPAARHQNKRHSLVAERFPFGHCARLLLVDKALTLATVLGETDTIRMVCCKSRSELIKVLA